MAIPVTTAGGRPFVATYVNGETRVHAADCADIKRKHERIIAGGATIEATILEAFEDFINEGSLTPADALADPNLNILPCANHRANALPAAPAETPAADVPGRQTDYLGETTTPVYDGPGHYDSTWDRWLFVELRRTSNFGMVYVGGHTERSARELIARGLAAGDFFYHR